MAEYMTAEIASKIANQNEMPSIMDNIISLCNVGEHRHIVRELSDDSAQQLAKLGYNIETFQSVDGTRFEIKW